MFLAFFLDSYRVTPLPRIDCLATETYYVRKKLSLEPRTDVKPATGLNHEGEVPCAKFGGRREGKKKKQCDVVGSEGNGGA